MSDSSLLTSLTPAHDVTVGRLVLFTGAVPERGLAPRGDRVTTGGRLNLTTTVRVIDRVHGRATRLRADAHVTLAAGFTDLDVLVLGIADRADRGAADVAHHPHLARGQAEGGHAVVFGHQLDRRAGGAAHLAAAARLQFHVVDDRACGQVAELEAVAYRDVGTGTTLDTHAHLEASRGQDVGLLAVAVVQQRDVGRAVRVVLDRGNEGGDPVLATLEVDDAVEALGAATAVTRGLATVVVATAGLLESFGERLLGRRLRNLGVVRVRDEAHTRARRLWLANRHGLALQPLQAFKDGNRLTGDDRNDGLLPVASPAGVVSAALRLARHVRRANVDHGDAEELFKGVAGLNSVGLRVHAERVLVARVREHVGLLRNDRADDDLRCVHQAALSCLRGTRDARAVIASRASSVMRRREARIRSVTPTALTGATRTLSRLRNEREVNSCSSVSTISVDAGAPHLPRSANASLVEGVSAYGLASSTAIEARAACTERELRSAAARSLRFTLKV